MMAVRSRALVSSAVLILAVAGCTSEEGADTADGGTTIVPTPSIIIPTTQPALKAAADCSKSDQPLPPESEMDGVELQASTDPTRTSLLLKNTGSLSVIVVPDESFTSRLVAAPSVNPTDQASKSALTAVSSSGSLGSNLELPAYIPKSQVFIVPPQWAVCALTDDVHRAAGARYLRDQASSAEYFVAKGLADQLLTRINPDKAKPTLISCAKSTSLLLKEHPELRGVQLYAEILGAESDCRASYKALLGNDERATQRTGSAVLDQLERTPQLLENTKLFEAAARG